MTQEKNPAATDKSTSVQDAVQTKKTASAPRKKTTKTTTAPKEEAKASAKGGAKSETAAKPRAAAKAKTTAKKSETAETAEKSVKEKKTPAKAKAPAKKDGDTQSGKPKAAAKPVADKKSAAPKSSATPRKAAEKDVIETPAEQPAAAKAPAKKSAAKKTASAKTAETAVETPKAPAKQAKPKTTAAKTTARKTASKSVPVTGEAAEHTPIAAAPADAQPAVAPKQSAPKSGGAKTAQPKQDASEQGDEAAARPGAAVATKSAAAQEAGEHSEGAEEETRAEHAGASRRSRRGGRRRNKSKNASTQAAETAEQDQDTETDAAEDTDAQHDVDPDPKADAPAPTQPEKAETVKAAAAKRKMFISVLSGELVEVVLAEEGQVAEYYVEMQHQAKVKGNIYKGVVSNIDANLQAAFISYAPGVKNGFLQIDEVHPEYYLAHHDPIKGRKYPPIQKVLKPGQEILVQVVKEPAGTKGAFLTSYLSLPGRFLVLTPGREQIGVSRKVDSDEERARLRELLTGLTPGKGLGVIVRTVSRGASKTSLQRDLQFLKRLWKDVRAKGQTASSPSLIYEELDLSTRAVRDYLTEDVQEVWVDDDATAKQVAELATLLFPKKKSLIQTHHDNGHSLFERFSLQKQLDQIISRDVALPSGGRLVIDNTEALTAIDINSGRSSGKSNFEDMAFRTNMEAAKAIPLQLRLRDIGGQVVVDFIEMRNRDHWREVEKAVRNGMKGDRARYDVGKIGPFGLLEIVRQRIGSSAISISTEPCPCCKGTGLRRNMEWQAMQALREIGRALRQAAANNNTSMTYQVDMELAFYLLNTKRAIVQNLETESGVSLLIRPTGE